jgi:probable HAF family extracellular repeat protein
MSGRFGAIAGPNCAITEDAHAGRIGLAPYSAISYLTESTMRRSRYPLSLFAAAALAVPLLASADPRYAVSAVAGAGSWASDINNLGQVVGSMPTGDAYHAFVYGSGVLADLGTLGGPDSGAYAINDLGQVVGNSSIVANGPSNGFLYSGGSMSALTGGTYMQAYGISNSGTIVGSMFVTTQDDSYRHAYTLSGGTVTDLGTLPYGDGSVGIAINSQGMVVGAAASVFNGAPNRPEDPFVFQNGVMTGLGNLGGPWGAALSVNELGQVAGYLGVDSLPGDPGELYPTAAFLYANGQMHVIGGTSPQWSSRASDVNNLGQVVGSFRPSPGADHAFLYENGVLTDLNILIDPASGWTITDAAAINDLQQIAAQACRAGVCQAVTLDLVSAVPEPPVVALLAAGLALGLARGRRGFRLPVRRRRG